jgi:hypothetical protein
MDKTDFSAFGQYIPGFDFLQTLARQAGAVKPDLQPAAGVMSSLGHWVAPTFSVEEIEKRIHDLRAVEFWLDQNSKALAATIQALEVQKMTLATLENMNLSLKDVAESFKIKPETVQAQAASRGAKAAEPPVQQPESSDQTESKTGVDPMQWWNSLTEQFTTIASSAVQDMAGQAAKAAEQVAQTVQASAEAAEKMAEQARQEAQAAAAARAAAVQQASEQAAASAAASQRPKAPARKTTATAAKKAAPPRSRRKPAAE